MVIVGEEDVDVRNERLRVRQKRYDMDIPVVIDGLRKTYKGENGKPDNEALKSTSLCVERGELLGLLGPNGNNNNNNNNYHILILILILPVIFFSGAGKTTLLSVLTGLLTASGGTAHISGVDIGKNLQKARKEIGFCPQFDVFWDNLTVEEHLLYYCRLRGVPKNLELAHVHQVLKDVRK